MDATLRTSPLHPGRHAKYQPYSTGGAFISTGAEPNGDSHPSQSDRLPPEREDGTYVPGAEHSGSLSSSKRSACFSLLEVKSGILDIAEALHFLHADAQLVHLNVNSDSVFLTPQGQWRLGGLGFALELSGQKADGRPSTGLVDCGFGFG